MIDPSNADICPICNKPTMPKWIKDSMETGRMCQNLNCKFIQIKKVVSTKESSVCK